jgi:type VI secretion system protein ImpG
MNREFLDLYNRELGLFYEHAKEFAEEYPGIANRLGGLLRDRADPMVVGLLEGAAFLAARVQLKLKHEFPEFTNNLLEQLVPHYLAPTPSAVLVKLFPKYGDTVLHEGRLFPRGSNLDTTYVERDRRIACRFKLTSAIRLWPLELTGAEYYTSVGPMQALGAPVRSETAAGLRLTLKIRTSAKPEDEPNAKTIAARPEAQFKNCKVGAIPIHLVGAEADANAIYEQIISHRSGLWLRYSDEFDNPHVVPAPIESIDQIGFAESDSLMPNDDRVFGGFDLLREYFMFSQKFLGFTLRLDQSLLSKLPTNSVDLIFGFNEINGRLAAAVQRDMFALYVAPAVNLFEMTTDRIQVKRNQHEYHVVPDKSRYLDFEPHRILDVHAHFPGRSEKRSVRPLYSATTDVKDPDGLFYTVRRMQRRRTGEEKRYGASSNYVGTDMFLSLGETTDVASQDTKVAELSVRALCSNRHLPEHLPVGQGQIDFRLSDDVDLRVVCLAGPTPPREPVVAQMRSRTDNLHTGVVAWRLINMLSLNHLGLVERGAGQNAQALREILATFTNSFDNTIEKRLRGVRLLDSRPVVRRIRRNGGVGPARGVEITLTLDEKAFEGSGAFLLGAVLDRFFSEYASFNHFTQLVVNTTERGTIMRWPARIGTRRPL